MLPGPSHQAIDIAFTRKEHESTKITLITILEISPYLDNHAVALNRN